MDTRTDEDVYERDVPHGAGVIIGVIIGTLMWLAMIGIGFWLWSL